MTEFTHHNPSVTSGTGAAERVPALRAVSPAGQATPRTDVPDEAQSVRPVPQAVAAVQSGEETARAHADYAKVSRDIADVVDSVSLPASRGNAGTLAHAEHTLLSLLPQPSVVLPMPPADEDMVAFVAQVTQSIARQAAQTRAALSGVLPATVEAAAAA